MKVKHGAILFVLGLCAVIAGILFKIEHWPGSDTILLAGMALEGAGVLVVVIKLLAHPRVRQFMNL